MQRTYFSIFLSIVLLFVISFRATYNTFFAKNITTVNYRYNKGINSMIAHDFGSKRFDDTEKTYAKKNVESSLIKGKYYKGILNSSKVKMPLLVAASCSFRFVFTWLKETTSFFSYSQSTSEKHILISVLRI